MHFSRFPHNQHSTIGLWFSPLLQKAAFCFLNLICYYPAAMEHSHLLLLLKSGPLKSAVAAKHSSSVIVRHSRDPAQKHYCNCSGLGRRSTLAPVQHCPLIAVCSTDPSSVDCRVHADLPVPPLPTAVTLYKAKESCPLGVFIAAYNARVLTKGLTIIWDFQSRWHHR